MILVFNKLCMNQIYIRDMKYEIPRCVLIWIGCGANCSNHSLIWQTDRVVHFLFISSIIKVLFLIRDKIDKKDLANTFLKLKKIITFHSGASLIFSFSESSSDNLILKLKKIHKKEEKDFYFFSSIFHLRSRKKIYWTNDCRRMWGKLYRAHLNFSSN